ncbi:60S ribosomal protein L39-1-like [Cucurbita maxima]|uniref:60S ribosomal protein L39-1-like n=1 Tax=Cucurbita maxima TaxID=3661 RepID=A0A6J1IEM1_CUCMA|nr:60S ribosomal protein L39-1-like [Cucurbita maxima]
MKKRLGKKTRLRPIPHWIQLRTNSTIRCNTKHRHWCHLKLGFLCKTVRFFFWLVFDRSIR